MTPMITQIPVAMLAGGLATRLRPITEKIPKSLVPVAGRPFLAHQLEMLHAPGHPPGGLVHRVSWGK